MTASVTSTSAIDRFNSLIEPDASADFDNLAFCPNISDSLPDVDNAYATLARDRKFRDPQLRGPQQQRNYDVINGLRERIRRLEQHSPRLRPDTIRGYISTDAQPSTPLLPAVSPRHQSEEDDFVAAWRFGAPAIDRLLPHGLDRHGVHEIKATPQTIASDSSAGLRRGASAADWMAGIGFAARMGQRHPDFCRAESLPREAANVSMRTSPIMHPPRLKPALMKPSSSRPWMLWCWPRAMAAEFGQLSLAGLACLGFDPSRLLIVETQRAGDALIALEDGLKSSSVALAFGVFDSIGLTPMRRLSLAAGSSATPCLLITHPAADPGGATATRWRVKRQPSAPNAFDARALGSQRFSVALERCRARPESSAQSSLQLEWCDEASCFRVASGVADHAVMPGRAVRRTA